ncbi:hypothetical protein Lal_00000458 [Lupinus albus]|uniref:Uncharacterized protein n=1 Tax=Lupinus albus TaxID=3870 RepID=A0A6A4NS26_LUPAL|nr:hypothetical protein Lalb_Chr21g0308191 [Lupinus albus]KAF1861041.1 hypothetical protein Lal_00000458 [Lupinus albus]
MAQQSLFLVGLICIILSGITAQSPTTSPTATPTSPTPQGSPPFSLSSPPLALTPTPVSSTPVISPAPAPEKVKSKAPALAPGPISPASDAPSPTLSSLAPVGDDSGVDKLMVGSFAFGCAVLSLLL